jgi:hypothetical protein
MVPISISMVPVAARAGAAGVPACAVVGVSGCTVTGSSVGELIADASAPSARRCSRRQLNVSGQAFHLAWNSAAA